MATERIQKGVRKELRGKKAQIRKEVGLSGNHVDNQWLKIREVLSKSLENWEKDYAPNSSILLEFFKLRVAIISGEKSAKDIAIFQEEYGKEFIRKLSPALSRITKLTQLPK